MSPECLKKKKKMNEVPLCLFPSVRLVGGRGCGSRLSAAELLHYLLGSQWEVKDRSSNGTDTSGWREDPLTSHCTLPTPTPLTNPNCLKINEETREGQVSFKS